MALRHVTVLVVDDDEVFGGFLTRLLEGAGYRVLTALSADGALAVVRETRPDAALVDVVMPGRGGYSLCRDLREEIDPGLPVVFLSGERADPLDRAAGLIAGGDDYLVKPVHPEELLARLRRLLERARPRSANAALDLSEREVEILQLIAEGRRPADVAQRLFIAPKTVSSHIQRIFGKLGAHTRAQAVAIAYEAGLIRVDTDVDAHLVALSAEY